MKRLLVSLAAVGLLVGLTAGPAAAAAGGAVQRYQTTTTSYTVSVLDTYIHNYTVTTNPCDGTVAITGATPDASGYTTAETITGTLASGVIRFTSTYDGPYNPGYSYMGNFPVGGGALSGEYTGTVTVVDTSSSTFKNHGDFVSSAGGGADAAHSCIGMPTPGLTLTVDAISDGGPAASNWVNYGPLMAADNPAALLWAGDVRMSGTPAEWKLFDNVYGRFHTITLPTPGNHDWDTAPIGYDQEFLGDPMADTATYCNAVTLSNGWQLFSINTYTRSACLPKLTAWLSATPGNKKIVVTHEPRWSGGSEHGSSSAQAPIWDAMAGHAIVLFSGHDHDSQVIESGGRIQVVNGCAGATYYSVNPITGEVYYSKSASDCSYDRFLLGSSSITIQAVHLDGSVAFTKTYAVSG